MTACALEVRDLSISRRAGVGRTRVFTNLSFELQPGATLAVFGASGSGKTLLARTLLGLLPPSVHAEASKLTLFDTPLLPPNERQMAELRGRAICMLSDPFTTDLDPTERIGPELYQSVRRARCLGRRAARQQARDLLEQLGIPACDDYYYAYPHQLATGMRERVLLALALSVRPKVLVLDELFGSLDRTARARAFSLVRATQQREKMSVLFLSSDEQLLEDIGSTQVRLTC
jgi:ABC-type microcin C transport system duplicated ATPase subunit YejF